MFLMLRTTINVAYRYHYIQQFHLCLPLHQTLVPTYIIVDWLIYIYWYTDIQRWNVKPKQNTSSSSSHIHFIQFDVLNFWKHSAFSVSISTTLEGGLVIRFCSPLQSSQRRTGANFLASSAVTHTLGVVVLCSNAVAAETARAWGYFLG